MYDDINYTIPSPTNKEQTMTGPGTSPSVEPPIPVHNSGTSLGMLSMFERCHLHVLSI